MFAEQLSGDDDDMFAERPERGDEGRYRVRLVRLKCACWCAVRTCTHTSHLRTLATHKQSVPCVAGYVCVFCACSPRVPVAGCVFATRACSVRHCAPLCATVCHSVPLSATGCWCVPLGATGCHCAPLCATVCWCVPLYATGCHCAPLCATVCWCVPLYATGCHSVRHSVPLCAGVCHCAPLCATECHWVLVCATGCRCVLVCGQTCKAPGRHAWPPGRHGPVSRGASSESWVKPSERDLAFQ